MKPLISVLVDTYNHERYIEQTLVSVIEQDFPAADYEIVVVDDGSTDGTREIVHKFAPRVRLLSKKNGGQASALNAAIPELTGEIVAMLDGDDWFARRKLAAVTKVFEENPQAGGVAHGFYKYYEDSNDIKLHAPKSENFLNLATPDAARDVLLWWQFLIVGSLTVRRKVLERVIPISTDLVFYADGPIAWAAIAAGVNVFEEPLCYYRHHANNLHAVNAANETKERQRCEMGEKMYEQIETVLLRLGVPWESLAASLYPSWVEHSRWRLQKFGGSRVRTFRTEMRSLRSKRRDPSEGLGLSEYLKCLFVGGAALLLAPELYYKAEVWYQQRILRHFSTIR